MIDSDGNDANEDLTVPTPSKLRRKYYMIKN